MDDFENIKFQSQNGEINVYISKKDKRPYLTIDGMSTLFNRSFSVIFRHITNIYKKGLANKESTFANFAHMVPNSNRKYTLTIYSFEIVVLVGKLVKSNVAFELKTYIDSFFDSSIDEQQKTKDIIIYDNGVVHIPIKISSEENTVWATQEQIATLYETTQPNVSMHIKNILEDSELSSVSVYKKSLYTALDGKQYFVIFYNLDMILAIGYRVKTTKAIAFRKWATSVLKEYLIDGYSINEQKCADCRDYLINLSQRVYRLEQLSTNSIVYFPGDVLRGFIEIKRFLETAKQEICIIDNYFGHEFDDVLKNINVKKAIITNPKNIKVDTCENYKVIKVDDIHDRYIMVDDIWYTFGGSPKDIGTSISTGHLFTEEKLIQIFKNYINKEK